MFASSSRSVLPPIPPIARLCSAGLLAAGLLYLVVFWQPPAPPDIGPEPVAEVTVATPSLDADLLATVRDDDRERRLVLEPEPLRHLLAAAINVGPSVALALGMPNEPVPVAEVLRDPAAYRGRWLWYKGVLEDLSGPRDGHPVAGYGIYEATVRLASGERVLAAFSLPPDAEVQRDRWVRVEGYLLKVRDTTYPREVERAPLLVGRIIQRDYDTWGPVTKLDPAILEQVDDQRFWPGSPTWRTIDEDQGEPLWHLGAFARDTAGQFTLQQWRERGTLNEPEVYPLLQRNALPRGTPMRILGTLISRTTLAAPANPAGITHWTVAYVQVRDFGGLLIPVWVPKRADHLPLRSGVEIRGYYYRWFAYEGRQGDRFRVPLFVAADLDEFHLETAAALRLSGSWMAASVTALMLAMWWGWRRGKRSGDELSRQLDQKRRKRRERQAAAAPATAAAPPPGTS